MQELDNFLKLIDSFIGSADWFVYFLLGTGIFFTFYLRFPQIRYFRHALKIVRGKFDKKTDEGDTSHFQALTTALSGTVGTGNIAGVALAIHLGGPAALFWMLVTAFLGMTTKFVEVTLSHKYREKDSEGKIAGGPMYFMKNKLELPPFIKSGFPFGKTLAGIFAFATVLSSFGTGSLPQVNTIAVSLNSTFAIDQRLSGAILAILLGFVIIGGISRIAAVTEKLVPLMAVVYLIGALAVIFFNIDNIVPSFVSIFSDIFSGTAATGGFLGAGFMYAFNRGVNRGLFSNEAGQGSAPIAHAAAKAHEPVSEGLVAILEPFIDTIVICTITGLVLLSSGVWNKKFQNDFQYADMEILTSSYSESSDKDKEALFKHLSDQELLPVFNGDLNVKDGEIMNDITFIHAESIAEQVKVIREGKEFTGKILVQEGKIQDPKGEYIFKGKSLIHSAPLTIEAFQVSFFGEKGKYIVSIGILLFAFSTAISWSYYGDRAMTYLWGSKSVIYYRIVYVVAFFFAAFADTTIIWTLSGITIALMTIPNLVGILMLHKDMKETTQKYWVDFKNENPGEKTPE